MELISSLLFVIVGLVIGVLYSDHQDAVRHRMDRLLERAVRQ